MKFLRLTIFMARSMHIIIMYPNIKYWENICNRLRDIQQKNQRTIGPENAHLKPDPVVLSHHEMTLTLNTHTPLLNS